MFAEVNRGAFKLLVRSLVERAERDGEVLQRLLWPRSSSLLPEVEEMRRRMAGLVVTELESRRKAEKESSASPSPSTNSACAPVSVQAQNGDGLALVDLGHARVGTKISAGYHRGKKGFWKGKLLFRQGINSPMVMLNSGRGRTWQRINR